jgi:DNA-binding HxlR family transcriptional regulator
MAETFQLEQDILRSVATIPIVIELRKGSRCAHEIVDSLRGIAAAQTINEALHRLMAGHYVTCTVERTHGIRKRYQLTDRGAVLAGTRIGDLAVGR